ncbi:polyprenyl synthetase family protein [Streptomyces sp. V4-01]|uniref:Polyprenyl synthetase family protein n=1 Tax=Actinacidiphila polyblastidii TaxID=3110430 RepID=A0ABU7PIC5_9ACTN|nr:polyprenyl synthetase family protein [Streptomyces sp. V4-01]
MRRTPGNRHVSGRYEPHERSVDADVAGAVGRVLTRELRDRVDEAAGIDAVFAQDVAERVARFALGGKRMRSQFLWWGLRAAHPGAVREQVGGALRIGAALELLQTCALVHDDVMDGSALRRGRPSVHRELDVQYGSPNAAGAGGSFGDAGAILVGDLALAWADDMVADTELAAGTRRGVLGVWRAIRAEMVAGQYLDLHGQATGSRSAVRAIRIACLKSALYSVERPLALGAALAGADGSVTAALCAAGRPAGIAFQLRDDLLSVFGDPVDTGKPCGEDIRQGKPTYLITVARERAEAADDHAGTAFLDAALGDAELSDDALARVRECLVSTGARAAVEARIAELVEQSAAHLAAAGGIADAPRARLLDLFQRVAAGRDTTGGQRPHRAEAVPAAAGTAAATPGGTAGARLEALAGGDAR